MASTEGAGGSGGSAPAMPPPPPRTPRTNTHNERPTIAPPLSHALGLEGASEYVGTVAQLYALVVSKLGTAPLVFPPTHARAGYVMCLSACSAARGALLVEAAQWLLVDRLQGPDGGGEGPRTVYTGASRRGWGNLLDRPAHVTPRDSAEQLSEIFSKTREIRLARRGNITRVSDPLVQRADLCSLLGRNNLFRETRVTRSARRAWHMAIFFGSLDNPRITLG